MKKSKFTLELEKQLLQLAPRKLNTAFGRDYMFGGDKNSEVSHLKFLGLSMPSIRTHMLSLLSETNFDDIDNLFYSTDYFEARTLAIYWLEEQSNSFLSAHLDLILKWVEEVDNWAHADGYCSIMARLFEADQKRLLPVYKSWNKHHRAWNRRCSLVGLFYYSRARKKQPSFSLAKSFVTSHLTAPEYYVQKAVGWTVREMYNVYPSETIKFIENHLSKITSVAWVAASEKLKPSVKNQLLKKRKTLRAKN